MIISSSSSDESDPENSHQKQTYKTSMKNSSQIKRRLVDSDESDVDFEDTNKNNAFKKTINKESKKHSSQTKKKILISSDESDLNLGSTHRVNSYRKKSDKGSKKHSSQHNSSKIKSSNDSESDTFSDNSFQSSHGKNKKSQRKSRSNEIASSESDDHHSSDTSFSPRKMRSCETDDDLQDLNNYTTYTSRDIQKKKPYKLLSIKITKEYGFNGPYKVATCRFEDKSHANKEITVKMPKPVCTYTKEQIEKLNRLINNNKHPRYVVNKITTRDRADGKGTYDLVDFKWI